MTEIRQRTGLSRDVANHRFRRLEELGLIEITYASEGYGDREPPKVAHLTGEARREIESGLLSILSDDVEEVDDAVDVESELHEMQDRLDRHQQRLDALSATQLDYDDLVDRIDAIAEELEGLDEYIIEWNEAAEIYLRALRAALEDADIDVGSYLRDAQEENTS